MISGIIVQHLIITEQAEYFLLTFNDEELRTMVYFSTQPLGPCMS